MDSAIHTAVACQQLRKSRPVPKRAVPDLIEVVFNRKVFTETSARAWLLVHGIPCTGTCLAAGNGYWFQIRPRLPWEARHIRRLHPENPDVGIDCVGEWPWK